MNREQRRAAEEARAEVDYLLRTEGVVLAYRAAKRMLEDPATPATARAQALKTVLALAGFDGKREEPLSDSPIEWTPAEMKREIDLFMRERQQEREEEAETPGDDDVFG